LHHFSWRQCLDATFHVEHQQTAGWRLPLPVRELPATTKQARISVFDACDCETMVGSVAKQEPFLTNLGRWLSEFGDLFIFKSPDW